VRANTNAGAPGFILPPTAAPGTRGANEPLPQTVAELRSLGLSPPEVALEGGFQTKPTAAALAPLAPERTFIHGLRRSRLKGGDGQRTWTGSAVFAYNVETYGRLRLSEPPGHRQKPATQRRSPKNSYFPHATTRPTPALIRGK